MDGLYSCLSTEIEPRTFHTADVERREVMKKKRVCSE